MTGWKQLVGCNRCSRTYLVDPKNPPGTCPDCNNGPMYKWAFKAVKPVHDSTDNVMTATAFREYREQRRKRRAGPGEGSRKTETEEQGHE